MINKQETEQNKTNMYLNFGTFIRNNEIGQTI